MREVAVLLVCGLILGCSTVSPTARDAVQEFFKASRTQFSPQQEYYIGRAVAARILSVYKPYLNDKLAQYVNLVGQTLAIHSPRPETYGGYHFLVLDSDGLNSLSGPGGFVFITRGLLRLSTSEDMVGCILAYSIGHVVMQSGVETIRKTLLRCILCTCSSCAPRCRKHRIPKSWSDGERSCCCFQDPRAHSLSQTSCS